MLDNLKKYKVILASNSPRRKELLAGLGVDYEVRTLPDVDESYPDTLQGADIGGMGSKVHTEENGDILKWVIEKYDGTVSEIDIDRKESNKY